MVYNVRERINYVVLVLFFGGVLIFYEFEFIRFDFFEVDLVINFIVEVGSLRFGRRDVV